MKFTGFKPEVTVKRTQKHQCFNKVCRRSNFEKGLVQFIHASMKVKDLIAPITGTLLISVFAEN